MTDHSHTCHVGSCQRHRRCMYTPCRSSNPGTWDGTDDQPLGADGQLVQRHTVVISARQSGKTLRLAQDRVRRVAKGATINGTYKLLPEPALDAFRADLLLIVGE